MYSHLLSIHSYIDYWSGWRNLWRIHASPRAKFFIWLLLRVKVKTYDYLNAINLGLVAPCVFYGLENESAKHIFNLCPKVQILWITIDNLFGYSIMFTGCISNGNWLEMQESNSIFKASIVVATICHLWKAGCDQIFQNQRPNFDWIAHAAIDHVKEYNSIPMD